MRKRLCVLVCMWFVFVRTFLLFFFGFVLGFFCCLFVCLGGGWGREGVVCLCVPKCASR